MNRNQKTLKQIFSELPSLPDNSIHKLIKKGKEPVFIHGIFN